MKPSPASFNDQNASSNTTIIQPRQVQHLGEQQSGQEIEFSVSLQPTVLKQKIAYIENELEKIAYIENELARVKINEDKS